MEKSCLRTNNEIAEIYQRHVKTVYRVCFTYLKNAADTEDATADTFVKMMRSAPAFESGEHEKAWLIRTAINVCKDSLKHWWRRREDVASYSETLKTEETFETDGVIDAVTGLPDKYKSVVYLYYFEGYTGVQIAEMLHKPQSTIRNYLHEARNILRERLGDFDE
ncbi:MAG: RNA polymerase sigma factor [Clostridiales Family XIII bacterium]|jgi:RNA polymerase sigma-70 factor (ECF subfamily)|nr:RNA polymerase sigma factor [Clostridiales Family XIII bacterium]